MLERAIEAKKVMRIMGLKNGGGNDIETGTFVQYVHCILSYIL